MEEEFMTLSTVADKLNWSITMVKYWLGKSDIPVRRIKMGKHMVRILNSEDVAKIKEMKKSL